MEIADLQYYVELIVSVLEFSYQLVQASVNLYNASFKVQSTLVISNSKGLTEILRYPYLDTSELRK